MKKPRVSFLVAISIVSIIFVEGCHLLPPSHFIMDMVLVEGGAYVMGDTTGDGKYSEKPAHEVFISYDFWIGTHEVTYDEYAAFCNEEGVPLPWDSNWGKGERPVINVSWKAATNFCNWLSEEAGIPKAYDNEGNLLDRFGCVTTDISKVLGYRLPTEAEWEYAARGGNKSNGYLYAGSDNVDLVAWYYYNSGQKTSIVCMKMPNELGIYDMSGNVHEWCSDWWDDEYYSKSSVRDPYNGIDSGYKVFRGGSYSDLSHNQRVFSRGHAIYKGIDNSWHPNLGFRICMTEP